MRVFKYIFIAVIVIAFSGPALAQDEEITLTTYYPAPYGNYEQLQTNTLAIGSSASVPSVDGMVNFQTIPTLPSTGYTPAAGDMYYDGSEFKYYKDPTDKWQSVGGKGGLSPISSGAVQCGNNDTLHEVNFGTNWQLIEFQWTGSGIAVTQGIAGYIRKDGTDYKATVGSSMYDNAATPGEFKYLSNQKIEAGAEEVFYGAPVSSGGFNNTFTIKHEASGDLKIKAKRVSFIWLKWD